MVGWLMMRLIHAAIAMDMLAHLVLAPWIWWYNRSGQQERADRLTGQLAKDWSHRILRLYRCEVRIEGLEHVPRSGPLIIAANHQSLLDIPVCLGYLGRSMGFVAKKELFRIPLLSFWMRQIHCASIDRQDIAAGGRLLEDLSQKVRDREGCMIIFPEGTRSRHPDGELGPFKRGALRIAQAQGIPVLPLSIDGTRFLVSPQELWRTRKGGRFVRLRISPPRQPPGPEAPAPESKRFMDSLREEIHSNREAIRVYWTTA